MELEASASSPRVTVEAVEDPCPKDPQINVRQASDRYAMPEAAALVHSNATPGVWELVDEAIDRYAELPTVKKALEAQREQGATDEGSFHSHHRRLAPQDRPGTALVVRTRSVASQVRNGYISLTTGGHESTRLLTAHSPPRRKNLSFYARSCTPVHRLRLPPKE